MKQTVKRVKTIEKTSMELSKIQNKTQNKQVIQISKKKSVKFFAKIHFSSNFCRIFFYFLLIMSYGPQLPPHLQKQRPPSDQDSDSDNDEQIGPKLPGKIYQTLS